MELALIADRLLVKDASTAAILPDAIVTRQDSSLPNSSRFPVIFFQQRLFVNTATRIRTASDNCGFTEKRFRQLLILFLSLTGTRTSELAVVI